MPATEGGGGGRRLAALLALTAAAAVPASAAAARRAVDHLRGPFGSGASQVWLIVPTRHVRLVVVFAHGWWATAGAPDEWLSLYRPWLDHLASRGDLVIFPRYQNDASDPSDVRRVNSFRAGLESGFAHLHRHDLPVVSVGYSFGGPLAFTYAVWAGRWHLPEPVAVDAVFPAQMIAGQYLPPPPPRLWATVYTGDHDTVAGTAGADELWSWLAPLDAAHKGRGVVHSRGRFVAIHDAPKWSYAAARLAFWRPFDRLIHTVIPGTPRA